jgi:hypothetical protein
VLVVTRIIGINIISTSSMLLNTHQHDDPIEHLLLNVIIITRILLGQVDQALIIWLATAMT